MLFQIYIYFNKRFIIIDLRIYRFIIFIIKWNNFKYFEPDMNNST